jgi:radical SAM protein with 4Fe4S-binding SPASM domain
MSQHELSTEQARRLIDEIAKLKPAWVIVEGGEPLLRPDLFELLGLMRQSGLEVHLITNGMCLAPGIAANLKQLGVRVMISIDAACPATYEAIRTGAVFEEVVRAARGGASTGVLEAINTTMLKMNYTEIPAVFRLAQSLGAPKINFIGLKPCVDYRDELLTAAEYREAIQIVCQAGRETGVEFFFDEPFFGAAVEEMGLDAPVPSGGAGILEPSRSGCIFGEYLFIEVDGGVKPCSFAPLVVANVNEKPLTGIWEEMNNAAFFQRIKDARSRIGRCRQCPHLADCKGCRSRTFALTGDWFAADPACPLPGRVAVKKGG